MVLETHLLVSAIPFVALLLCIALGQLLFPNFWNRFYKTVSVSFAVILILYYSIFLKENGHIYNVLREYLSFIALLSSLFITTGGILIKVNKKGAPLVNVVFLLCGAMLSNFIGTTGASVLLIRPFLRMNQTRIKPYLIIFFIFIVSNIGGSLTPIGDPPLFLGFLNGVPFFWVIKHVWLIWLFIISILLLIFYLIDSKNIGYSAEAKIKNEPIISIKGGNNFIYLSIIIFSVFLDPHTLPWLRVFEFFPIGLRELIMFSVAAISYVKADKHILKINEFDFEPIKEVAFLFFGIFFTMIPALQIVSILSAKNADSLTPGMFFWFSGGLSAVLDNAPTYLNFISAALGKFGLSSEKISTNMGELISRGAQYVVAVSVGSVFFGAMSYIGNGPNFMVKSICESAGVKMPSFFEYILKYSIPILLPVFFIIWLIFI